MRKPKPYPALAVAARLGPPLAAVSLRAAGWLMDHQIITTGTLVLFVVAWVIGGLLADVTNPSSWLRQWGAWRRRVFDVEKIIPRSVDAENVSYVVVTARLRFVRDAPRSSVVLDIQSCKLPGGLAATLPSSLVVERRKSFVQGEQFEVVLATVPIKSYQGKPMPQAVYGSIAQPGANFVADSVNIVTIKVKSVGRQQCYRVHLRSPITGSHAHGRVICMGEDYDSFDSLEGAAFH